MSKFFQNSSDSDSDTESENEIVPQKQPAKQKIYNYSDDEEKDVVKKVVLPEKAKRSQEINGLVKQLKNAKKIKDLVKCSEVFEELAKSYEKCKKIVEKDGHFKQYIRCLGEYENFINELWADTEWRATASNNNNAQLKKIRQRIKKYYKAFESEIADFAKHPENYPEEEKLDDSDAESARSSASSASESSDEESDVEGGAKKDIEDDDDEDWSSSSSSDEGSDIDTNDADAWKHFLIKTDDQPKEKRDRKEKGTKQRPTKHVEIDDDKGKDDDQESVSVKAERPKLFPKEEDITCVNVVNKLNEISASRGKKGVDRKEQTENMNELKEITQKHNLGKPLEVKILFNQIALMFDYNQRLNKCMKTDNWTTTLGMMEELLQILKTNENIQVGENIPEESENVVTAPFRVRGCPLTMLDRMLEEFVKILQNCDAHGSEYVEHLKDEPKLCALTDTLQVYYELKGTPQEKCRIYLKKIENLYYKYDYDNSRQSKEIMEKLCKFIYTMDNTDRIRTQAMLCHIYHHALHDRWFEARDLMLMSHLQESIDHADIPLQISYNRTMVQVGLCAFRVGNIKESHAALLDIQSGNRAKEFLAQGMVAQRNIEKTAEQELKERQRLIPFHMHINLELLECMYLVSAMLIEIPYMSSRDYETKKRLISKQFHYQLKTSERQPVVGPPENMREHVVAASRAMRNGDWRACLNFLVNPKMNAKVWDLIPQSAKVKAMLNDKVKEESLRTYIFRYSSVYESINVASLAEMFELPRPQVYSTISKMIINEELMASLDEPTETVVMHRTEPTKLQTLALQLSEKVTTLMDHTERIMQLKGGEMGPMMGKNQQQQQQQNQQSGNWNKQSNWNKNQNKQHHRHHNNNNNQDRQQNQRRNQHHHHHQNHHHSNQQNNQNINNQNNDNAQKAY